MTASDIPRNPLIERLLPSRAIPYSRMMRLDRPIGTWLLLLPGLWAIWLSVSQTGADFKQALWMTFLFSVGAIVMRGAGCVVNDIADRDFDAKVARTATRPIPSGQVSVLQACLFVGILALIGLVILLQMNSLTLLVGASSLILIVLYPFAKRVTYFPQAVLGLTFNYGALMGWTAMIGELNWPAVLLYIAGFWWTMGYDTIYAHQDKEDDVLVGVKSTALALGDKTKTFLWFFYAITFFLLGLAGFLTNLGWAFYPGLLVTGGFLVWHISATDIHDPENCKRQFIASKYTGMVFLGAILAGLLSQ